MKLFLKHQLYRSLTLSRMISSFGSYIYNLVFVIYAASLPQSSLAIFFANLVTVIPSLFTFWVGVKADASKQKGEKIIRIGFLQALLFSLVAVLIRDKNFLVFSLICLLNIASDLLSDYAGGLRMPIIQKHVAKEDLLEAYSFFQLTAYLSNILGQTFGLWLLSLSQDNFAFVAIINALSFALSSILLLGQRSHLTYEEGALPLKQKPLFQQFKTMHGLLEDVLKQAGDLSFLKLLTSVLFLNGLGGAVGSIYHFFLIQNPLLGLGYGQSLVLVEMVLLVAAILGSLFPHDYFGKQSIKKLLLITAGLFALLGLSNFLVWNPLFGLAFLALASYVVGKMVPKLDALLMGNLPAEVLAQTNNFIGMVFTLSLPLGILVFSALAAYNLALCWGVFSLLAMVPIFLVRKSS